MKVMIDRYEKYDRFSDGGYTYCAKIGTVTLESPNIIDLVVFIGLSGHETKLSFIDESEYK